MNDSLKIKWRGHPTERRAEGKAEGLTYPVAVHHLVHCGASGEFGIYYGGTLVEKVTSPWETDAEGNVLTYPGIGGKRKKLRDTETGYKLAKARAQELAPTWAAQDKAASDKRAAEWKAHEEQKQAAEDAAVQRAADTAEALKLADVVLEGLQGVDGPTDDARALAALVKKLLG